MEARVKYKIALLAFHAVNKSGPTYLSNAIAFKTSIMDPRPPYVNLIQSLSDKRPRLKSCGERTFYHGAVQTWNQLPPQLRQTTSLESFKKQLENISLQECL